MPWPRNDPDPFEERRRRLAEQERQIAERMSQLSEKFEQEQGEPPPVVSLPPEPPVWRVEEEAAVHRTVEPTPRRKRNLGRQRQRDMMIFFICIGVLVVVLILVAWLAASHSGAA